MNEQPRWIIKSKEVNLTEILDDNKHPTGKLGPADPSKPAYVEHTLRFDKKKVFTAKTPISAQTLKELCEKWNAENYAPKLVNGKLLCEMSETERLKLAALWSPELPFGEEVVS